MDVVQVCTIANAGSQTEDWRMCDLIYIILIQVLDNADGGLRTITFPSSTRVLVLERKVEQDKKFNLSCVRTGLPRSTFLSRTAYSLVEQSSSSFNMDMKKCLNFKCA